METPASTPQSRILGRSSMFRFFRSLVGSKGSLKSSDKGLMGSQACPSQEQDATPLMINCQGGVGRKELRPPTTLSYTLSVALPQHNSLGLGMGDTGAQIPTPMEVLRVGAQGREVKPILSRGSQKMLGSPSEKKEREKKEKAVGEASGDTRTSDNIGGGTASPQRAVGPLEVCPKTFTREEKECLLDGDLRLASSKVGFLLKESLSDEEKGKEEEMEEDDSSFKLCVPGIVPLQSPLHKTFRSTNTVGKCFVESELKKLLIVQRESGLWKMGSHEGQELLTQPEITLEEAGIVDGQHLLLEEMDEMGNWPP
uniref:Gametogenetin-binding protein 1 n=1 Tax=Canis lupus dingo TaxID=286419 RepID=A0A8C0JQK9_CANLU